MPWQWHPAFTYPMHTLGCARSHLSTLKVDSQTLVFSESQHPHPGVYIPYFWDFVSSVWKTPAESLLGFSALPFFPSATSPPFYVAYCNMKWFSVSNNKFLPADLCQPKLWVICIGILQYLNFSTPAQILLQDNAPSPDFISWQIVH